MPAIKITSENFESEVVNSGKTFLLDFWAPWCGPCRMVSPLVDEVADELNDGTKAVGKINVDEEGSLAERFGILSIPTLIVVRGNEVITKAVEKKRRSPRFSINKLTKGLFGDIIKAAPHFSGAASVHIDDLSRFRKALTLRKEKTDAAACLPRSYARI